MLVNWREGELFHLWPSQKRFFLVNAVLWWNLVEFPFCPIYRLGRFSFGKETHFWEMVCLWKKEPTAFENCCPRSDNTPNLHYRKAPSWRWSPEWESLKTNRHRTLGPALINGEVVLRRFETSAWFKSGMGFGWTTVSIFAATICRICKNCLSLAIWLLSRPFDCIKNREHSILIQ